MSLHIYNVTVSGTDDGNKFFVNSGAGPEPFPNFPECEYNPICPQTYRFDQSHPSNSGHILKFSSDIDGLHEGGGTESESITYTGTPGISGAYSEITPIKAHYDSSLPFYYFCEVHSGMARWYTPPSPISGGDGQLEFIFNTDPIYVIINWDSGICDLNTSLYIGSSYWDGAHPCSSNGQAVLYYSGDDTNCGGTESYEFFVNSALDQENLSLPVTGTINACFANSGSIVNPAEAEVIISGVGIPETISGKVPVSGIWCNNSCPASPIASFTLESGCTASSALSGVPCSLESAMSGQLDTVIQNANTELSETYGTHHTSSYSYSTGVETGQFVLCSMLATGATSGDSVLRMTDLQDLLYHSGICSKDVPSASNSLGINNINVSFGPSFTEQVGYLYYTYMTGYSDKRHYVTYHPLISGNKTILDAETSCPFTKLQVELTKNFTIHNLDTEVSLISGAIHNISASLPVECSGYATSLDVRCKRYEDGSKLYGKIQFDQGNKNYWYDYFDTGIYKLKYISGSFETTGYTLGSGTITAERYV
jgi:hypothetical protein